MKKILLILVAAFISQGAIAAPKYNLDDYVVLHKKPALKARLFMQAGYSFGKLENQSNGGGSDYMAGISIPANDLNLSTAIYHSYLDKSNTKTKGYGLRSGLSKDFFTNHNLGVFVGAGFFKQKGKEGRQISTSLNYEYSFNENTAFTLSAIYYPYAAENNSSWKGGNAGIKFYFR